MSGNWSSGWAGRSQKGLRIQGRRKEWADGGEEQCWEWLFLPMHLSMGIGSVVGNPNSGRSSTTFLGIGAHDDKDLMPTPFEKCFAPCSSPCATRSRSCMQPLTHFYFFIHFIQRPWCWHVTFQGTLLSFIRFWWKHAAVPGFNLCFIRGPGAGWKDRGLRGHTDPGWNPGIPLLTRGKPANLCKSHLTWQASPSVQWRWPFYKVWWELREVIFDTQQKTEQMAVKINRGVKF